MSATVMDAAPQATSAPAPLLGRERWSLGARITLAMVAAGLLIIAVIWRLALPEEEALAQVIAGAAAVLVAVPVLGAAWSSLRHPTLHGMTDQLVAIALIAAWAVGDLMTAALLPIVMLVGHVLEERSLLGSQEAIRALGRLVDTNARRIRADGAIETISAQALAPADLIEIRAGDRVPADGVIRQGSSSLDTASLTGESVPIEVGEGDVALAGSINVDGLLVVAVTRVGGETTLGKIIGLMQTAERAKPPVTRLLERYAGQYLVLILLLAAGVWFATGNTEAMLAVLVASCPCALVLAAPATAVAAIAVAARHGILIKGSAFLEQLADVTSVVVDKTGTVTLGELALIGALPEPGVERGELVALAASLGAASSHPVSRALAAATDTRVPLDDIREERGFGMRAYHRGATIALGRPEMFEAFGIVAPPPPEHDGPIAGLARGDAFVGWLLLADEIRPEARGAMQDLRELGLDRQVLLTGDRARVAARVGTALAIPEICAEALPEQKMRRVLGELESGFRPLVVGDGINDSLALKAGAVGIAMGVKGTDVALASADLVLMTGDLRRLATCIRLSRRCRTTIHTNVAMGLGWTLVLIVLAATGALGAEGAIIAAVLHNLSTLAGIANAGRLLLFDETRPARETA